MINYLLLFFFFVFIKGQLMFHVKSNEIRTYYYAWGDEFSEKTLNTELWQPEYGWGNTIAINGEQQYYTKSGNIRFMDGNLIITAKRQDTVGNCLTFKGPNDSLFHNGKFIGLNRRKFPYTSGIIQSKRKFKYGYYEIKFKAGKEQGFWPAFWLYDGEPYEEIDWMELKTEYPDRISVNLHHGKGNEVRKKKILGKSVRFGGWIRMKNADYSQEFVNVSGLWNEKEILFFVNGILSGEYPNIMHQEKLLVANLAVAQDGWAFSPGPKPDFKDSLNFIIDYIRVWNDLGDSESLPFKVFEKNMDESPLSANYFGKIKTKPERKVFIRKKNIKQTNFFIKIFKSADGLKVLYEGNVNPLDTDLVFVMENKTEHRLKPDKNKNEYFFDFNIRQVREIRLNYHNQTRIVKIT
ncbi:MAG: glycoside hydrolase family 16 protein [Bacteroidia bacterium]|nr:glycoside hydrolase family 16 protein [Bacteroidia bacterium]